MLQKEKSSRKTKAVTRAILFTDIVGSTKFFADHGDNEGLIMIQTHNKALFPLIETADGNVVKTIGDSIFAVFENPANALIAAAAMQKKLDEERKADKFKEPVHIRVGVHYGLVYETEGDYFGDAVNLSERVKSSADKDKICVSEMMRDIVKGDRRFEFTSIGERILKGASEPMQLFELNSAPELSPVSFQRKAYRKLRRYLIRNSRKAASFLALLFLLLGVLWWYSPKLITPHTPAVAVLPFRNLSSNPHLDYLSIALTDELNTQLRSAGRIIIRPTSSVMKYREKVVDVSEAAKELKVETLIEGSYITEESKLKINASIVDAKLNQQTWAGKAEGLIDNLLSLLDKLSRMVISQFKIYLAEHEPSYKYGTENPKAYENYLHGLSLQLEITEKNNLDAIRFLEDAVKLDANFARAHAALSNAYATRFWWNFSNDTIWLERSIAEANQSIALNPNLAEAHYALAYSFEAKGMRQQSIIENIKSYKIDNQYVPALTNIARFSFYIGNFARALGAMDRIGEIDPTKNIHVRKAIYLYFAGRLDESHLENKMAEDQASGVDEMTFIGFTYAWLNDLNSAERMLGKLKSAHPDALSIHELKAWIFTAQGKIEDAKKEMEYFSSRESWGIVQELAALSALHGDKESAIKWLEKAVAMGAPSYAWFKSDHFKCLQGNQRYEVILEKLNSEYEPIRNEIDKLMI